MRILIVEDEESLAELVANRLKKEKYIVDISLDGEEGLYNALEDLYDLIILDIMLPGINGIEILKEIRKNNIKAKLTMNLSNNSSFKGTINNSNTREVNLTLDKTSTITLTGDTYVKSLTNADTTNSNINLNGYKLYVNGKEYKNS